MKTALFTLAALFGLGLGLALVGAEFGLLLLALLLAILTLAAVLFSFADRLQPIGTRSARFLTGLAQPLARLKTRTRPAAPFLPPLLSALMGLALGAALARTSADLPAALLCGALAAALHLMAAPPPLGAAPPPPPPDRIADQTQVHLARLITALAPCRDPHLHVAARALRREALALAAQVDRTAAAQAPAHRALTLWLPALAEAAEHLRQHHLAGTDPAPAAELTATLVRVTAQLARLSPQPDSPCPTARHTAPGTLAQTAG